MEELRYSERPAIDLDDGVRSELAEADRRFCDAVGQGDFERAARDVYTRDAIILPPGADIVRGRDDIVDFWREAAQQLGLEKVELATVELTPAGDHIHQIGRAVLTAGGQEVEGKYTVLWRQEDGRWKWHVDCWNLNA